jgi:hypothetical protein
MSGDGELEALAAENERLRAEYARAKRNEYRRSAVGLAAVGGVAALAALAFPSVRDVLFALAATGGFAAVLTYYLTPERVVAASVGERVYAAWASNATEIAAELGLSDERRYVPVSDGGVRLFVPQSAGAPTPEPDGVFQSEEGSRGVALRPAGESLFGEFEATLTGGLAERPGPLVDQLAEGVAEAFELVEGAEGETENGAATLAIEGSAYGDATRFDHPVGSVFAVGLARGLDETVALEAVETPEGRAEYVFRATWAEDA